MTGGVLVEINNTGVSELILTQGVGSGQLGHGGKAISRRCRIKKEAARKEKEKK